MQPNMLTVLACTILCVMAVSHSASLGCETLVEPVVEVHNVLGRWALVAGSLKDPASAAAVKRRDSTTLYFHNSSYTQVDRVGGNCEHHRQNFTEEGHVFGFMVKDFNFTAIFLQTSCADCVVLTLDVQSPTYRSHDVYLFSRRRDIEEKEMKEFKAQVECLHLPPPVVMDPTKDLCPENDAPKTEQSAQLTN